MFVATAGGRTAFQNFLTRQRRRRLCGACTLHRSRARHRPATCASIASSSTRRTPGASRPNVTLDYGVRYALYPPMTDKNNLLVDLRSVSLYRRAKRRTCANAACTAIDPQHRDPARSASSRRGVNSPFGDAHLRSSTRATSSRASGSRGIQRRPAQTIVRGAYGIYYDQPLVGIFEQNSFTMPPVVNNVTVTNPLLSQPGGGPIAVDHRLLRTISATATDFKNPRMHAVERRPAATALRRARLRTSATSARAATT